MWGSSTMTRPRSEAGSRDCGFWGATRRSARFAATTKSTRSSSPSPRHPPPRCATSSSTARNRPPGSGFCRQVGKLFPAKLVMFEIAESPLFELEREMREKFPSINIVPLIGDIRDRKRVEAVMSAYRPSLIYHAAAYKHVPMMEVHPAEAVKNNIFGTQIMAEVAAESGVRRVVLVSTDKAVRPTNVMGATKRGAGKVVLNMNGEGRPY